MFIDTNTSREDLLQVLNSEIDLVDAFIKANLDETAIGTDDLRDFITSWIEAGDECAQA